VLVLIVALHGDATADRVPSLSIAGVELLAVEPPAARHLPVRLVYGHSSRGRQSTAMLVDVVVAQDAETARAAQVRFLDGLATESSGGIATVVADNVFVAARRVTGDLDATRLARQLAAELRAASAASRAPRLPTTRYAMRGVALDGVLSARVTVNGVGVRAGRHGWFIPEGTRALEVIGVDAQLRVVSGTIRVGL
jgi:hypothetical protein